MTYQPQQPHAWNRHGFNLIEVVLALAVLSFALVGIISLFPLALNTAKDSKNETRVTLIAQTLLAELTTGGGSTRTFCANLAAASSGNLNTLTSTSSTGLDLTRSGVGDIHYLTYDMDGNPTGEINSSLYNSGSPGNIFIGLLRAVYSSTPNPLTTVSIQIEWPASATPANRKKHTFITFLAPDS